MSNYLLPRYSIEKNWNDLVPEITFALFLCDGIHRPVEVEDIANKATATYPGDFTTLVGRRAVPDLALMMLALTEARRRQWGYVAGNWYQGWRLTKKGLHFARNVEHKLCEISRN